MQTTDLQTWISEQTIKDEMLWKSTFGRQMSFLRNRLQPLIAHQRVDPIANVISTHRSKSIVLPVVAFERPDIGLRLVVRENFYNWKLSVISERPIDVDLSGLCHTSPPPDPDYTGNPLASCYFEGFPEDLVFGFYDTSDRRRWSAEFWGDEPMYVAVFLIMRALGVVEPLVWSARK